MGELNAWWHGDGRERYFMETTDRDDLGVDLWAPMFDDKGKETPGYSLVTYTREGDVVFHYMKNQGFVGWSRVSGTPFEDRITWGAQGKTAQLSGVVPYDRPAWTVPLVGPFLLDSPVGLAELRSYESKIKDALLRTERATTGAIYRPFQLSNKQPLRATQAYLSKLPEAVIRIIPELRRAADYEEQTRSRPAAEVAPAQGGEFGRGYVTVAEDAVTRDRQPFDVDPAVLDRGVRGHAVTQNGLAAAVSSKGWIPVSPRPDEPAYDVAWRDAVGLSVAEVKSLTEANEERQLRLGLGQVLRYKHILAANNEKVTAILAVERRPRDESWISLCSELGVVLCWGPDFRTLPY